MKIQFHALKLAQPVPPNYSAVSVLLYSLRKKKKFNKNHCKLSIENQKVIETLNQKKIQTKTKIVFNLHLNFKKWSMYIINILLIDYKYCTMMRIIN